MSLREEIQDSIYMKIGKEKVGITWIETKEVTNEILKHIQNKIELVTERQPLNEYFGYSGDEEFLSGFDIGFEKALELVEMELEK